MKRGRPRTRDPNHRIILTLTPDEMSHLRAWMEERNIGGNFSIGLHDMLAFYTNNGTKIDSETGRRIFEITQPRDTAKS
jgi:hypothetical protein